MFFKKVTQAACLEAVVAGSPPPLSEEDTQGGLSVLVILLANSRKRSEATICCGDTCDFWLCIADHRLLHGCMDLQDLASAFLGLNCSFNKTNKQTKKIDIFFRLVFSFLQSRLHSEVVIYSCLFIVLLKTL